MSYVGATTQDQSFTLAASQTVTGYQVLQLNTSPTNPDDLEVQVPSDGTAFPIGVAQVDDSVSLTSSDGSIAVRLWGVTKAIASKAISVGAHLSPTTNGRVTDAAAGTGKWFVGIALTEATALGDEILMLIKQELDEA